MFRFSFIYLTTLVNFLTRTFWSQINFNISTEFQFWFYIVSRNKVKVKEQQRHLYLRMSSNTMFPFFNNSHSRIQSRKYTIPFLSSIFSCCVKITEQQRYTWGCISHTCLQEKKRDIQQLSLEIKRTLLIWLIYSCAIFLPETFLSDHFKSC